MPTNILMPALSPTMEEGMIAKWLVKEGDFVSSGDLLAEIETDKAVMEFESADEGVIGKLIVAEGSVGVKVNEPIAVLLEEGESISESASPIQHESNGTRKNGSPEASQGQRIAPAPQQTTVQALESSDRVERIFASPLARRIAAENGLDLALAKGSGPRGRIVKVDVLNAISKLKSAESSLPEKHGASEEMLSVRNIFAGREFEEVKLDGMRKTIAARLTESKQTVPHFYLRREFRMDALINIRAEANEHLAASGQKISINDFLIKAAALALQRVPDANAVWAGDRILRIGPSDVAVAVAVDGGLFTPIVRDAHAKKISEISTEMKDLAARARTRSLAPNEYTGGSFALSNLGMYGVENFDAIINPPHGSILAVGTTLQKPVFNAEGSIERATVISATLSVDHRTIDGALGAKFLDAIKNFVESPIALLI